MGINVT